MEHNYINNGNLLFSQLNNNIIHQNKPGPQRKKCIWCNSTSCSHCQCIGTKNCDHDIGKMCERKRYCFFKFLLDIRED